MRNQKNNLTKNKKPWSNSKVNKINSAQGPTQIKPLKRFGQHFLRNPYSLKRLLEAIEPQEQDCFIEIGSGDGSLTLPLSARCKHVIALEIDKTMVEVLQQKIQYTHEGEELEKDKTTVNIETLQAKTKKTASKNISILQTNALKDDLNNLYKLCANKTLIEHTKNPQWRMVGNLPYNISAHLIERFLMLANFVKDNAPRIVDMHFLVQKEIAQRLFAVPSSANYSRLSLMRQTMAQGEKLINLPPHAFTPPPKVMSSLIYLKPQLFEGIKNEQDFYNLNAIVGAAFHRPNRLLNNTLQQKEITGKLKPDTGKILKELKLTKKRAKETSLEEFIAIMRHYVK